MNRILYRDLQPEGWLKRQLEIQAEGLAGNLDRVWPDVRDSAWIGGDREGWERVPYWLDGFIPLACLLRDEDLTDKDDQSPFLSLTLDILSACIGVLGFTAPDRM